MAGSSHYNALCEIYIYPTDKQGETGEIRVGPGTSFPFITSVEIVKRMKMTTQITLSIEAPFAEGKEMLNGPLFFSGNSVIVRLSYPDDGTTSLIARGTILKGGVGLSLTPNGISGTLTVQGHALNAKQVKPIVLPDPEPKSKTLQWLEKVVSEAGYDRLEIEDSLVSEIEVVEFQINGALPIIDYLQNFCDINALIFNEVYDKDKGVNYVKITDYTALDKASLSRIFVMRDSFVDTGYLTKYDFIQRAGASSAIAYPIVSFNPEITSAFFTGGENIKVRQAGIVRDGTVEDLEEDEETQANVQKGVNNTNSSGGTEDTKAGDQITQKKMEKGTAGLVVQPLYLESTNRDGDRFRIQRVVAERMINYSGTLTTFGIPDLEPNEKVGVVGLGSLLDGVFTISGVTQTWNAGKLETSMTLFARSNGLDV